MKRVGERVNMPQQGGCSCLVSLLRVSHRLPGAPACSRPRREAFVGFPAAPPKKWVFPNKPYFQVAWNQPGSCVAPYWDGTMPTLILHWASPRSRARGHLEAPVGTGRAMMELWEDAGSQARSRRWAPYPLQRPASSTSSGPRPPPAFDTPPSFSPAPRQGLRTWPTDDTGRDSPREGVCFMPGRRTRPTRSAQSRSISPLPSPK